MGELAARVGVGYKRYLRQYFFLPIGYLFSIGTCFYLCLYPINPSQVQKVEE
jgi:hypothetical protein